MNTTTTAPTRQSKRNLRSLPAWQLNQLIRRAGLGHLDIAKRAGTSEPTVSAAVRRRRKGPAVDRVWKALEAALGVGQ